MKMKQSTEFKFNGDTMTYCDVQKLWQAVVSAGSKCKVTISQTTYDERPYGTSTTTTIEVEANASDG